MNKYEIVKFAVQEFKQDINISLLEKTIWINIKEKDQLLVSI